MHEKSITLKRNHLFLAKSLGGNGRSNRWAKWPFVTLGCAAAAAAASAEAAAETDCHPACLPFLGTKCLCVISKLPDENHCHYRTANQKPPIHFSYQILGDDVAFSGEMGILIKWDDE